MPPEPAAKRCFAFIDGQNLFYAAKAAFGHRYPNYSPETLAGAVRARHGWQSTGIFFYTGVPTAADNPRWHRFWTAKLAAMGSRGVQVYMRPLRYRRRTIPCPHGHMCSRRVGQEKGVDLRIGLDLVRMARTAEYDVALVFSQDQDLTEAVEEVKAIAREQHRWMKVACAFPVGSRTSDKRGIDGTDWIRIDRATYDACLDPKDYRG